jgi:hypothetical protein
MEIHLDCRSQEGITVGLIDSLISICRVLARRDMKCHPSVIEALKDMACDEDVRTILDAASAASLGGREIMAATTDPSDPGIKQIRPDGQQEKYLVLSEEERAKGFIRPVRDSYKHLACGTVTIMGHALAETYARDPKFYGGTFCCACGGHFPLLDGDGKANFVWDKDGSPVGS